MQHTTPLLFLAFLTGCQTGSDPIATSHPLTATVASKAAARPPRPRITVTHVNPLFSLGYVLAGEVDAYRDTFEVHANGVSEDLLLRRFIFLLDGDDRIVRTVTVRYHDETGAIVTATAPLVGGIAAFTRQTMLVPHDPSSLAYLVASVDADDGTNASPGLTGRLVLADDGVNAVGITTGKTFGERAMDDSTDGQMFVWHQSMLTVDLSPDSPPDATSNGWQERMQMYARAEMTGDTPIAAMGFPLVNQDMSPGTVGGDWNVCWGDGGSGVSTDTSRVRGFQKSDFSLTDTLRGSVFSVADDWTLQTVGGTECLDGEPVVYAMVDLTTEATITAGTTQVLSLNVNVEGAGVGDMMRPSLDHVVFDDAGTLSEDVQGIPFSNATLHFE